jgi:hypothetical protein
MSGEPRKDAGRGFPLFLTLCPPYIQKHLSTCCVSLFSVDFLKRFGCLRQRSPRVKGAYCYCQDRAVLCTPATVPSNLSAVSDLHVYANLHPLAIDVGMYGLTREKKKKKKLKAAESSRFAVSFRPTSEHTGDRGEKRGRQESGRFTCHAEVHGVSRPFCAAVSISVHHSPHCSAFLAVLCRSQIRQAGKPEANGKFAVSFVVCECPIDLQHRYLQFMYRVGLERPSRSLPSRPMTLAAGEVRCRIP